MIRFASLGSGSKGNGILIESGTTRILIDCGFSLSETERRLHRLNCHPATLTAILVTHEHGDHANGIGRLSRRYHLPVYLTVGSNQFIRDNRFAQTHYIGTHARFDINDLDIKSYPIPHDAREPCQFVVSDGQYQVGVLTDTGGFTPVVIQHLQCLDALMLECNYDLRMLEEGPYPSSLKQRVAGRFGHLSNFQASQLLQQLDTSKLQHLIGMHLSEQNNLPTHALRALSEGINSSENWIRLANQEDGFSWCEVR